MMTKTGQVLLSLLLCFTATQVGAQNSFTHAVIKLPFSVQVKAPWSRIISSQEDWQQFYDENKSNLSTPPPPQLPPSIDFELFTVVVGGLDSRYSHSDIAVQSVNISSSDVYLSIAILTPGKNCIVAAVIAYPNIAIVLPKYKGALHISTQQYTYDCPA